jgi:hypothetical protein
MMRSWLASIQTSKPSPRAAVSQKRLRKLSRIHFRCTYPQAAERLKKALSWVEAEWKIAQAAPDKRMLLEIQGSALKSCR